MAKGLVISFVIVLLIDITVVNCVSQANTNARGRSRFRNESSDSRETQILSVFDTILNAIDAKLKKIDNLERAVERLNRRIDEFDTRQQEMSEYLNSIDQRMTAKEEQQYSEPSAIELEPKIAAIDQKVSSIDSKIHFLANHIDNTVNSGDNDTYRAFASQDTYTVLNRVEDKIESAVVSDMKSQISAMDKNVRHLMEFVADHMNKMLKLVADVKEALMGGEEVPTTTPTPRNVSVAANGGSKLDALFKTMSPLLGVSEKMDEVWDVLVGTKTSVDTLVPNSEQLLWQTQRQERAIIDIHSDLNTSVQQIIENLSMVEKHLHQQKNKTSTKTEAPTTTTETTTSTTTATTTTTTTEYTTPRFLNEPISLPTDLMDKEFLGDDPIVASKNSSKSQGFGTTKIPYDYWNKTRNSNTSTIIFPSVKNKPTSNESSYDPVAPQDVKGYSCAELYEQGLTKSGIYYLLIRETAFWYLKVYCDMETEGGGWTVIQRRDDYGEIRENFNRDWEDYKSGFGEPLREFWLGNENIFMLTNVEDYSLRVDLEDFEGNRRFAEYSSFKLYSEKEQYKLEIGGYTGNAGDSLNDPWYGSNLSPFSTYNRDNDRSSLNCASMLKGGWWWKSCGRGLNGYYLTDPQDLTARQGIVWFRWRGWDYTLKRASMMIRPRYFGKERGEKDKQETN